MHDDVEGEPGSGQALDVVAKQRALRNLIRHDVEDAAETFHERIGERAFQNGREIRGLRAAGGDGAADQAAGLLRLLADEFDLAGDVGRRDVDLHVEHVGDARPQCVARIFAIEEVAVERRLARDPGVVEAGLVDEMQMRVDEHGVLLACAKLHSPGGHSCDGIATDRKT